MDITKKELAALIDHTLLKPESTSTDVERLCNEATEFGFCSVCILPVYVSQAADVLRNEQTTVCTVVSFPLGAADPRVKAAETALAVEQGAGEIDMVINVGLVKSGQFDRARSDIAAVVEAAAGRLVKVILETCLLTDSEKNAACLAAVDAGAGFVKTSTGFSHAGATTEDVRLMRETVGPALGVKASGGIRDYRTACEMIEAGANRLGTSSGPAIIGSAVVEDDTGY